MLDVQGTAEGDGSPRLGGRYKYETGLRNCEMVSVSITGRVKIVFVNLLMLIVDVQRLDYACHGRCVERGSTVMFVKLSTNGGAEAQPIQSRSSSCRARRCGAALHM